MSETKFTPGPWHWVGIGDEIYVETEHTKYIASLKQYGYSSEETQEANAHLIAAAPHLFEALNMMLFDDDGNEWFDSEYSDAYWDLRKEEAVDLAKTALAKARGEA
jgi:hypothetical protein